MNKYQLFRKMLALMEIETCGKVTDADLNYHGYIDDGGFRIEGLFEQDGVEVTVDVTFKKQEEKE